VDLGEGKSTLIEDCLRPLKLDISAMLIFFLSGTTGNSPTERHIFKILRMRGGLIPVEESAGHARSICICKACSVCKV